MVTIADHSLKNIRPAYAFHGAIDGHHRAWARQTDEVSTLLSLLRAGQAYKQ